MGCLIAKVRYIGGLKAQIAPICTVAKDVIADFNIDFSADFAVGRVTLDSLTPKTTKK